MIYFLITCMSIGGTADGAHCSQTQVPSVAVCKALVRLQEQALKDGRPENSWRPINRCVAIKVTK